MPLQRGQNVFQEAVRCCAHGGLGDTHFATNIGPWALGHFQWQCPGKGERKSWGCSAKGSVKTCGANNWVAGLPSSAEACGGGPRGVCGLPPDGWTGLRSKNRQVESSESPFPAGFQAKLLSFLLQACWAQK